VNARAQWVRFVSGAPQKLAHFRVFESETRFCVGFDWVRFAADHLNLNCAAS